MTSKLRKVWDWFAAHFDAALLLAAAVEIPRWTVTFLAIHEPLWVGIPLGALLAYATSEGWKAYFADRRRWMMLTFNGVSLIAAVFVITPVLFSMANAPIDEIDLAQIMPQNWLLAWSAVLAVTTFAPLIQLAAVKSTYTQPAATQEETTHVPDGGLGVLPAGTSDVVAPASISPDAQAPQSTPQPPEQARTQTVRKNAKRKAAKPTPSQRQAQISSAGMKNPAEIASYFAVSVDTAKRDLEAVRKATTQTNGVHA